jgi:hypothetical protein
MPPRKEEDEYSALAMELLQAEPIPTPTRLGVGSSPDRLRETIN